MAKMPSNARSLTGLGKYGIDAKGEKVFFSLLTAPPQRITFLATHKGLADTIHYLQGIARSAHERRIAKSQENAVEMLEPPPNLIRKGSIMPDTTGQLARMEGTTASGAAIEVQIDFKALVGLYERLPPLIDEMRQLQAAQRKRRS
jgi:hypothetical protein